MVSYKALLKKKHKKPYFHKKYEFSKKKYKNMRNAKNNYFKKCKRKWRSKLSEVIAEADISSKNFWSAIGKYNFSKAKSNFAFDFINHNKILRCYYR